LPAPEPLVAHRIRGAIHLDGRSDEPAWREVAPLPVVSQVPRFGAPPSERTEILLAYDERYLYVAGRFYDREPGAIHATTMKRDDSEAASSDAFGVVIDTYDDNENALAFVTTPTASRLDFTVSGDAQLNNAVNPSWNTVWDVAAVRTAEGWFAEMRIPFSSLRFQETGGRVVMGLIAYRWIARRDERIIFPAVPLSWGDLSYLKPSQAWPVAFTGIRAHRPVYVTPYHLGGSECSPVLARAGDRYGQDFNTVLELGLDAKYSLTSNLTLDLTVNTDFAQVEADDQQINLTRFPLFFPEKRLFFLERSSNFDFSFYRENTLFHSRRIGIHDGRPVPLYGGARLVGRVGPWDVGLLTMQSQASGGLASQTYGVLRLRRQVINPYSYAGAIVTTQVGTDHTYNTAYGLDGIFRVVGDDYLKLNWAQTYQDHQGHQPLSLRRSKIRAHWERYRYAGWAYGLNYSRSGADYDPALGFEKYPNKSSFIHFVRYGWDAPARSLFFQHGLYEDLWLHLRNADYQVESCLARVGWFFSTKSGYSGHFNAAQNREDVTAPLAFADGAEVPPDGYVFYDAYGQLATPGGGLWHTEATLRAGQFYDGRRASLTLDSKRSLSRYLELGGAYELDRVRFPERDAGFTAHIGRVRSLVMLSTRFSASAFVQYSTAAHRALANLRLRYTPREGTDLYLVYDEGLNTDRGREDPALPASSGRALLFKASTTLMR
ncbi:MAG: DUF5916 domain-containing protein, partial [Gemmatimonadota bacterium]